MASEGSSFGFVIEALTESLASEAVFEVVILADLAVGTAFETLGDDVLEVVIEGMAS